MPSRKRPLIAVLLQCLPLLSLLYLTPGMGAWPLVFFPVWGVGYLYLGKRGRFGLAVATAACVIVAAVVTAVYVFLTHNFSGGTDSRFLLVRLLPALALLGGVAVSGFDAWRIAKAQNREASAARHDNGSAGAEP